VSIGADFHETYAAMSEEDLLGVAGDVGNLVPSAREALKLEMAARNLPLEQLNWEASPSVAPVRYGWGLFQGWMLTLFGVLGVFMGHSLLLLNLWGIPGALIQIVAGYAIIRRLKYGILLFDFCGVLAALGVAWGCIHGLLGDPVVFCFSALALLWWGVPAFMYYPDRNPGLFRKNRG